MRRSHGYRPRNAEPGAGAGIARLQARGRSLDPSTVEAQTRGEAGLKASHFEARGFQTRYLEGEKDAVDPSEESRMRVAEVAHGSPEYAATIALRLAVLRIPLGLDFTDSQLAAEISDVHLAAFDGDAVVGCLVLTDDGGGQFHMRQVVVAPAHQRQGIGRLLVLAAEESARQRGFQEVILHARDTAVPFYLALGYTVEGDMFEEVTIPHFKMGKRL